MAKSLKDRLKEEMKVRGVKTPALSEQTGIPKDRIYAWYRDGTSPKMDDQIILEQWLLGKNSAKNEENGPLKAIPAKTKLLEQGALLSVLVSEVAALRASLSGEHPEVIVKKIYKAAEDVARIG